MARRVTGEASRTFACPRGWTGRVNRGSIGLDEVAEASLIAPSDPGGKSGMMLKSLL